MEIKEHIPSSIIANPSPKEVLDSMSDIELTEDEVIEAMLIAKQKKYERLKIAEIQRRAEESRKSFTSTKWDVKQTDGYMRYRMNSLESFKGKFVLDQNNQAVYDLLCAYFSDDYYFPTMAAGMGVKNPSPGKGIMLLGNFGVGKTWLMRLFAQNQKQVYFIRNAKVIADEFEANGESALDDYEKKFKNPANDKSAFYQPYSGLCIDDLGTEGLKNHFGNKKNVIGDIIETRYSKGDVGVFLHASSNLNASELTSFYGERVVSRMREIFNFIEVRGADRRKSV